MRVLEDTKTAHIVGQQLLGQVIQERDDWRAEATRLTNAGTGLIAQLNAAQADAEQATAERDTAISGQHKLRLELERMRAECEGLRADALAYPPQRLDLQQYANLKADHDRQVIMIETLQEALKRTETLLAKAQAQHIDDRLKGFLSVISQLADQAQDLLP